MENLFDASEGAFHNLVFVSIKKTYPMQAYKIMHGLWGAGQMMFAKYIIVVDDDVDVHNTSEVLFRLGACTDPQRDGLFTRGPADVLDHATTDLAIGTKLGIDATHKLPGEACFHREWPPLIRMDEAVKKKVDEILDNHRFEYKLPEDEADNFQAATFGFLVTQNALGKYFNEDCGFKLFDITRKATIWPTAP